MEDPSDHEVKLHLLPHLSHDNNASTTVTTTTTITKRSNHPLPLSSPPPFQICQQPEEEEPDLTSTTFLFPPGDPEDPSPHHQYPTFMLNFLVALTFGLLIISVLSALGFLESSTHSPIFTIQSATVKSLTLTNTSTPPPRQTEIAASGLTISLRINNPYSYSKLKASVFQGCDLLGELVVPENMGSDVDLGPQGMKNPSDFELDFGRTMMRLRVVDWISMNVERNQAIGVSSFGVKIVAMENGGDSGAAEQQVEMWCGSVFLGFSTDPLAGKLLFGPARCRQISGGTYGSDCV